MNHMSDIRGSMVEPFRSKTGIVLPLVVIFLVINGLVLLNACLHDPGIGYDAHRHHQYIQALSKFRPVTPGDSDEFFSPPLPYIVPAVLLAIPGIDLFWALKLGQLFNVVLSVGLTFYLLKTCRLISEQPVLRLGTLVSLGILPVYYKTFAFVRGEPYVAFFAVVILYYMGAFLLKKHFTLVDASILGTAMGLCALSRQWGILLFPAVFLSMGLQWLRSPEQRHTILRTFLICLVLIALLSGWFYLMLNLKYGSMTAFNNEPETSFSFKNQPLEFYTGFSRKLLFTSPIRPNFPNQFFPIFYSELWGDYWGYFSVYGLDINTQTFLDGKKIAELYSNDTAPGQVKSNYRTIGAYLGRVNLIGLFPSTLAIAALMFALFRILKRNYHTAFITCRKEILTFVLLAIATTIGGYFWFLIMYPNLEKGTTIKATYVLHIFPYIALLIGDLIEHIKRMQHVLSRLILILFCLISVHNVRVMVTNYSLHQGTSHKLEYPIFMTKTFHD